MDAMTDLSTGRRGESVPHNNPVFQEEKRWPGPIFFAISPDADAALDAERTARLLRVKNGLTGAPYPQEALHVSLLGIGRRPGLRQEVVEAACVAAAAVVMPPFEVAFDRAASFRGQSKRPFVLFGGDGVIGIEMLQRALISELEKAGFSFKQKSYEPHMALLYDRRRVTEQFVAPIHWSVREFVLIHSLHGLAKHDRLGRWKLPERAYPGELL